MTFETELGVRFRDVDAMGHVNNAVYATYLEQARVDYFAAVLGVSLSDVESVLASLSIDYERPIQPGGRVRVTVEVPSLGESSIPMAYEVFDQDGNLAATGETVQVAYDRDAAAPRPLPREWRTAIVEYEDL